MHDGVVDVLDSCRRLWQRGVPIVAAVSGGVDSMVLMHALSRVAPAHARLRVATFDHRSGPHAQQATRLVEREAHRLGLPVEVGTAVAGGRGEAFWRSQRWEFLRRTARALGAVVATGHTRDDHLETVVMRILRGAGARGLAGLLAPSDVRRPLVGMNRSMVLECAQRWGVRWIEDPTNGSPVHLRNRVRHDLLPALRTVWPGADTELLDLARRAAEVRAAVEDLADRWAMRGERRRAAVSADLLRECDAESRALVWPALLARAGIVMDARGIRRLASIGPEARLGSRVQLSGGFEILNKRGALLVAQRSQSVAGVVPLADCLRFGRFRFTSRTAPDERGVWGAWLCPDAELEVRAWRAGDRVAAGEKGALRRVKRFLVDAQIPSSEREGWPVVVHRGEITWVPGVCRVLAATAPSGGAARYFACELVNR